MFVTTCYEGRVERHICGCSVGKVPGTAGWKAQLVAVMGGVLLI